MRICIVFLLALSLPVIALDERPTVRPERIDAPPLIDGVLDEAIWQQIEPITDFRQQEPADGEPASERTEVRICYDDNFLYIGVRAHDSEPEKIIARVYERDGESKLDDSFFVAIDSLHDRRTAFVFGTNAIGMQGDGQFVEGSTPGTDWDAIWHNKSNIDDQGYTLEIAIPFFVLRFQPAEELSMGILMRRVIRRKDETVFWPYLSRDYPITAVSQYATLEGLRGIERGVNLEVKPYAVAGRSSAAGESEWSADAGLDAKWGVTSNLTADLTLNTDFAQVESDALQVNLTRFNLYYPEKRDFFLESAGLFQFGLPQRAEIFFSRRIGIRGRDEVPILGGARLYGLVGDTNIGLMSIQSRARDGIPAENFTVARIKQNVLGRSYIGGILTNRSGYEADADRTMGADFAYVFGRNNRIYGSLAQSSRPGVSDGNWFGVIGASYFTDLFQGAISYIDIGPQFNPGLGFIRRRDMRSLNLSGAYKPRPGWDHVRQITLQGSYKRVMNYAGEEETVDIQGIATVRFSLDDFISFGTWSVKEYIPYSFQIAPGIIVPSDQYEYFHWYVRGGTSYSRRVSISGIYETGGYYGGDFYRASAGLQIKLTPQLQIKPGYAVNRYDLPGGSFTSIIANLYMSYYVSPTLITRLALQHSGLYDEFIFNFRLRWIYAPGSEAWLVYDEGQTPDLLTGGTVRDRALILKVVHNFNF